MAQALDILLEILSWVGFGAALLLLIAAVGLWAADGTWLPADAIVDDDGDELIVRWIDGDGEVNSARPAPDDAAALTGRPSAEIWYRYGWHDRMRLTRRPAGLRPLLIGAAAAAALGVASVVASVILLFVRG